MKKYWILFLLCPLFTFAQNLVRTYKNLENGKRLYGYADRFYAKTIIACEYDSTVDFTEGMGKVIRNGKFGFVNNTGKLSIPCTYDSADSFNEGLALVKKNNTYFFIDKSGVNVFKKTFVYAKSFQNGMAQVTNADDKIGYINKTGVLVVDYKYDKAFDFGNNLASVLSANQTNWQAINTKGEVVFTFSNEIKQVLGTFKDGNVQVAIDKGKTFVNTNNQIISTKSFANVEDFTNNRAIVSEVSKNNYLNGLINKDGKLIVEAKYSYLEATIKPGIYYYSKVPTTSKEFDGFGLLDSIGNEITKPSYANFTWLNDTTVLCKNIARYTPKKWQIVNLKGKEMLSIAQEKYYFTIAETDTLLSLYTDFGRSGLGFSLYHTKNGLLVNLYAGMVSVFSKQKLIIAEAYQYHNGYIMNFSGRKILDSIKVETLNKNYDDKQSFPFLLIKKASSYNCQLYNMVKQQFVNDKLEFGTDFYQYPNKYSHGLLAIKQDGKWGFMDSTGKIIIKPQYEKAGDFSDGWAVVTKRFTDPNKYPDTYSVYIDTKGKEMPGIKANSSYASDYKEGFAFYITGSYDKTALYYIDNKGKQIFKAENTDFFKQGNFSNGMAAVCNNSGKYGYINSKGELAIAYQYDLPKGKEYPFAIEFNENGFATVYKNGKAIRIDKMGKEY